MAVGTRDVAPGCARGNAVDPDVVYAKSNRLNKVGQRSRPRPRRISACRQGTAVGHIALPAFGTSGGGPGTKEREGWVDTRARLNCILRSVGLSTELGVQRPEKNTHRIQQR